MEKLIPIHAVEEMTGFKKSSIYKRIQEGTFPAPVKIGRASRWAASAVQEWIVALLPGHAAPLSDVEGVTHHDRV